MKKVILTLVFAFLFLASCNNSKKEKTTVEKNTSSQTDKKKYSEPNETTGNVAKEIHIEISSTDQMQYDKTELKVKAGQKVTLTLKHIGKMTKEIMGHNWVLLKQGTDIAEFATKAMNEKARDYIPSTNEVIAYTKMIGGGEKVSITFDAPKKGTYDFICSFPGHYAMMKGKFIVE